MSNEKLNLTCEQINFICEELDYAEEKVLEFTKDEWTSIRERCFFIEVDEHDDKGSSISGEIAADIASITYKELFE